MKKSVGKKIKRGMKKKEKSITLKSDGEEYGFIKTILSKSQIIVDGFHGQDLKCRIPTLRKNKVWRFKVGDFVLFSLEGIPHYIYRVYNQNEIEILTKLGVFKNYYINKIQYSPKLTDLSFQFQ